MARLASSDAREEGLGVIGSIRIVDDWHLRARNRDNGQGVARETHGFRWYLGEEERVYLRLGAGLRRISGLAAPQYHLGKRSNLLVNDNKVNVTIITMEEFSN